MSRVPRATLVAGLVAGLVGLLACMGALRLLDAGATVGQRFTAGSPVLVDLTPTRRTIVWGPVDGPRPQCVLSKSSDAPIDFMAVETLIDVRTRTEGRLWRGRTLLTASPAGPYALWCSGDASVQLATGTPPRLFAGRLRPPPATSVVLGGGAVASGILTALAAVGLLASRRRPASTGTAEPSVPAGPKLR